MSSKKVNNFNDFELIKPLGSGAFGSCYLYRHVDKMNTLVVIKRIKSKENEAELMKQLDEVKILERCQHPFVIGFYGCFQGKTHINIVMHYCEGGSLADFLDKRKEQNEFLKDDLIVFYLTQMTMALDYLHKLDIIHCDLKPDNVLMNKSRNILKLADFGISRTASKEDIVESGSRAGTCYYIAPEIYTRGVYDKAVDVWALGCVLYELMELQKAFPGPQSLAQKRIINASWSQPEMNKDSELLEILKKCLEATVEKRATTTEILFMPPIPMTIGKLSCIIDV